MRSLRDLRYLAPVLAFVAAFALVPVSALFVGSVVGAGGLSALGRVAAAPANRLALENSLVQGVWSAAVAVGVGYPVGIAVGRYSFSGRGVVRALLLVPFLLPSLVIVLGIRDLFGASGTLSTPVPALGLFGGGLAGIVVANLAFNVPVVALFTAAGCAGASPDLEEAVATLGASPARAYRDVWGRPTWVGAAAGGLLTFVFSALSFAPPLILGGTRYYTVEAQIYALDRGAALDPNAAGVLALIAVAIFLVPTLAYLALIRRLRSRPGRRANDRRPFPWRTPVGVVLAGITAAVLAGEAVLLAAVLYRSVRPPGAGTAGAEWIALFSSGTTDKLGLSVGQAVGNTVLFAVGASALALLLGVAAAYAVVRRRSWSAPVGLLVFLPLLLSPVVLAFALADSWRPLLGGESGVWALIVVSQATLALPFVVQSLEIPLSGLSPAAGDAARTLGAGPWTAYLDVDLPRIRGGLATAGLFAFALGLGEFTATYFLVTPQYTTVPVALYNLSTATRYGALSDAVAGLLLVLSLGVFAALAIGGRRVEL